MTERSIRIASSVRVPIRAGETIQIINSHDEEIRLNTAELSDTCTVDLDQFSDNITAGLPLFLPVKPHRSGLHDNDNDPRGY